MKYNGKMTCYETWIFGWIQIVSGIVRVLSFGFLRPHWCYYWIRHLTRKPERYVNC